MQSGTTVKEAHGHVSEAIDHVEHYVDKVEFWACAVSGLTARVPEYDLPEGSRSDAASG